MFAHYVGRPHVMSFISTGCVPISLMWTGQKLRLPNTWCHELEQRRSLSLAYGFEVCFLPISMPSLTWSKSLRHMNMNYLICMCLRVFRIFPGILGLQGFMAPTRAVASGVLIQSYVVVDVLLYDSHP